MANTDSLLRLSRSLRAGAPAAHRAYHRQARTEAAKVLKDAQARASYSTRIPQSGKIRMLPSGNVRVTFGGESAPDAAPLENRGKGNVRHPLFGDREHWYTTKRPAFLTPAFLELQMEMLAAIEAALIAAVERAISGE